MAKRKGKYSARFDEDYQFYFRNVQRFNFSGSKPVEVVADPGGPDAKQCFHTFDSQGRLLPCSEPAKLQALLLCKASVNWHIKQWVEGHIDGTFPPPEMRAYFEEVGAPSWVEQAVMSQVQRKQKAAA